MTTLKRLEDKVRVVLSVHPEARDDDRLLALRIWSDFYGIGSWTPISEVLANDNIPSLESIGRVRRKVQELEPELRGTKRAQKRRKDYEQTVRDYVKEA